VGGFGFGRIWALSSAILRICRNLVMFGEDLTKLSLVARMENLSVMKLNLFEWCTAAGGGGVGDFRAVHGVWNPWRGTRRATIGGQ